MEIQGQQIMITGANRGIGRAIAQMCAENHAHLHLLNRTWDADLKPELERAGAASVNEYQVDLAKPSELTAFLDKHGEMQIDVLINNAGQLTGGLLEEQPRFEIDNMFAVNVQALVHLTRSFLPGMVARKKGLIVNNSSVAAFMHFPANSTYSASKAAVAAFSECLRAELKGTGVGILLLLTPGVETRMFEEIKTKFGKNFDLSFMSKIPSKKYAAMVREAIIEDLEVLKPHGLTGWGLLLAEKMPWAFQAVAARAFKR